MEMVFEERFEDIADEGFSIHNRVDSRPFEVIEEGLVVDFELEWRFGLYHLR